MSGLWFNVRFGEYHWQWGPHGMSLLRNEAHAKENRQSGWKWFQVYEWFGKAV